MTRVLLVDDSERLRGLYRMALEASPGFEVVGEASNGADAIDVAREKAPDVVLLDLSMPTMDGIEALPRIRLASPKSHVVVLTGFRRERLGDIAREMGASDYVEKGILPTELAARIDALARGPPPAFYDPGREAREALARRARELV